MTSTFTAVIGSVPWEYSSWSSIGLKTIDECLKLTASGRYHFMNISLTHTSICSLAKVYAWNQDVIQGKYIWTYTHMNLVKHLQSATVNCDKLITVLLGEKESLLNRRDGSG